MRKKIAVLLILLLCMCSLLCACGNNTKNLIEGKWKYMPTDSVISFDKKGFCTIDGVKYEYKIEDSVISIISWGTLRLGTEDKWDVLKFSSGEIVGTKENEYEEYYQAYESQKLEEFYNNTTELKIDETNTLSDGTSVTLVKSEVVGEDYPQLKLHFNASDISSLSISDNKIATNEDELISIEIGTTNCHSFEQDGLKMAIMRIGDENFTQQTLDEKEMFYFVFKINDEMFYFNVKNVTIPDYY